MKELLTFGVGGVLAAFMYMVHRKDWLDLLKTEREEKENLRRALEAATGATATVTVVVSQNTEALRALATNCRAASIVSNIHDSGMLRLSVLDKLELKRQSKHDDKEVKP